MRPLVRQVPRLQRLAIFEAVARLGTFTAAGNELGISQPAVSKQVAQLEDHLHLMLFDRSGGRPRLTDDGSRLHQAISTSFAELEMVIADLRRGLDVLTIALQPAVAENWFAPHLDEINEAVAPAEVHVVMYERNRELQSISHNVSIRFGKGQIPHMRTMKLADEIAVPAASRAYSEAHGLTPSSTVEDLLECNLLEFDQTGRNWANWAGYFESLNVDWSIPEQQIVYRAHASVIAQALAGRGVVLTWRKIRDDLFNQELLVECGPTLVVPEMGQYLVWPAALSRDPGFRRLQDWLVGYLDRSGAASHPAAPLWSESEGGI